MAELGLPPHLHQGRCARDLFGLTPMTVMQQYLTGAESRRDRLAVRLAALMYSGAWILGLLVAPSAPSLTGPDATAQAFFVAPHGATLIQALLVHGVAGIALGIFVILLARLMPTPRSSTMPVVFLGAGLAAVGVSLIQVGLEIALNCHVATDGGAATTASLFHAVNIADTVKLALLGVAIAAASRGASGTGLFARWSRCSDTRCFRF